MKTETIVYLVVALLLGMLLANMLKNVCGCKTVVEGQGGGLPRCEGLFRVERCSEVEYLSGCNNYIETFGSGEDTRQCGIINDSNYVNPEQEHGTCGRIREPNSRVRQFGDYPPYRCNSQDVYIANPGEDADNRVLELADHIFSPYLDCVRGKIFNYDGSLKVENTRESVSVLVNQGSYNEENKYIVPTGSIEECFVNLNKSIDENLVSESSVLVSTAPNEPCRSLANTSPIINFMFDGQCGYDGYICDPPWQGPDDECIIVDGTGSPNASWAMCKEKYFSNWKNQAGDMEGRQCYDSLDTAIPIWINNTYNDLYDSDNVTRHLGGRYINYTTNLTGY